MNEWGNISPSHPQMSLKGAGEYGGFLKLVWHFQMSSSPGWPHMAQLCHAPAMSAVPLGLPGCDVCVCKRVLRDLSSMCKSPPQHTVDHKPHIYRTITSGTHSLLKWTRDVPGMLHPLLGCQPIRSRRGWTKFWAEILHREGKDMLLGQMRLSWAPWCQSNLL